MKKTLIYVFLLIGFSAWARQDNKTKPALPKGVEFVTSVEGITEYKLPNGMRVLLFPDQSKPTITVNITYLVGSRHENYGETGMAHLLEHLVFKGTPKHPNIPQELTAHGARPNGTTWLDRTNYYETFSASEENLKWALDLESDRMVNSYIAKKDLDSEMTVVRNEFESGENDPTSVLLERVTSTAYLWHNYGKSTIGARADIENVPIDRLQAFYKRFYQPDNAILMVAGKIDEAKTLEMVNSYFSPIPKPTRELVKTYTAEPTQDGERFVTLRRSGDIQVAMAAYHIAPASHPDYIGVEILNHILTNSPSGRLYKALVESKKGSSAVGFAFPLKEPGITFYWTEVRKEQSLDSARRILLSTLDNLSTEPVTKEEVDRAKAKLMKDIELAFNSAERIGLEMSEYLAIGDWRLFFIYRDRVKKMTLEEVQKVATTYFKPSNRTTGLFVPTTNPDRAEIPLAPDVAAMVKDYKGEALVAAGEAFEASPSNIDARTKKGVEPNSISYALLSKTTRGKTVVARLTMRYGSLEALSNKATVGRYASSMLDKGTSKRTRQQIKDELDRLKARVNISGSYSQTIVSIETIRENLPEVLNLVSEILKDPIFPVEEFEKSKQEELVRYEEQQSDPQALAFMAYQKHLNAYPKDDPRYVKSPAEEIADLKALTLDEVKKFYKDFFGTSNAQFSVVGDFDEQAIKAQAAKLFGNWKSPQKFVRIASSYKDAPSINQSIKTPDKANAIFLAGMNLPMKDDDENYAAIVLGNYMLGGGFLNSRLATRIRQKEGISYGVGSQLNVSSLDKTGSFMTFAIYAPENVDRLETAFKEEIAKVVTDGFTAEEIAAAKSGYLQSREVSRAQDAALVGMLNNYLYVERSMAWDADFEKKVAALTPDQIKAVMKQYLDQTKMSIIKAGDFKEKQIVAPEKK